MSKDMIIHVGLHKTGTTFLQREVFSKMDNVYSTESLSGEPYFGFGNAYWNRELLAKGMREYFGDVKIIVGVRNKEDWVKSVYRQVIVSRWYFKSYDYWRKNDFEDIMLDFEGYIDLLKSLFSEVYVYHYEDLQERPEEFMKGLFDFIGQEVEWKNVYNNKTRGPVKIAVLRLLNLAKEFVIKKL